MSVKGAIFILLMTYTSLCMFITDLIRGVIMNASNTSSMGYIYG